MPENDPRGQLIFSHRVWNIFLGPELTLFKCSIVPAILPNITVCYHFWCKMVQHTMEAF